MQYSFWWILFPGIKKPVDQDVAKVWTLSAMETNDEDLVWKFSFPSSALKNWFLKCWMTEFKQHMLQIFDMVLVKFYDLLPLLYTSTHSSFLKFTIFSELKGFSPFLRVQEKSWKNYFKTTVISKPFEEIWNDFQ